MEKHHQTLSNQPPTCYRALNTHTELSNIYCSQLLMQVMIMLVSCFQGQLYLTMLKNQLQPRKLVSCMSLVKVNERLKSFSAYNPELKYRSQVNNRCFLTTTTTKKKLFSDSCLMAFSKAENFPAGSLQVPQKTFPSSLSTHIIASCFAIYCYIHFLKG